MGINKNQKFKLATVSVTNDKFKSNKKIRRFFKAIGKVFSITAISAIAVMLITVCIVACAGIIYFDNYETSNPIRLEDYATGSHGNSKILAYDSNGNEVLVQELQGEKNKVWATINEIPQDLQDAVIAIEDERFYSHYGVDWKRTAGAFLNEVVSVYATQQGGSTITQQLIKNLTGESEVTLERKFNEILQALELERKYSKAEILEVYLNEIYLSNNCYGVQAASRRYFDKDVNELNLAECATLAVITNAPTYYDPILNPDNNKVRQEYCLSKMLELGMISEDEYNEAVNYKLIFHTSDDTDESTTTTNTQFSYYTDYVIETVIDDLMKEYDYTYDRARELVMGGGLTIYSAVDLEIQEKIEYIYENKTAGFNDDELQSAVVLMKYDGQVVGMVGGAGEKTDSLSFNRAVHSKRPPGSTMKPLSVYSYGIENNLLTWSSLYLDYAVVLNGKLYPQNVDRTHGTGKMVTIQYAISRSTNTVAVRLAQEFSVKNLYNFVQNNYHITTLEDSDMALSPMALGGMTHGVKVIEMAAAYQVFGNGGIYNSPYCYYEVRDSEGKILLSKKSQSDIAISADTAWVMNKLLQTVTAPGQGGTGQKFGLSAYGIETFGKSGSTNDYCDVWFCGGSPYYVAAVWTGFDESKPINVYAGNTSGIIWSAVMKSVHSDLSSAKFTPSENIIELDYCTISGLIAGEHCESIQKGWYKISNTGDTCTTCQERFEETTPPVETPEENPAE